MVLYGFIIIVSTIIIAGINILFGNFGLPFYYAIIFTFVYVLVAFIIDALVAWIVRDFIPEKTMNKKESPLFHLSRKKEVFYVTKLKIRKWKDIIPELGGFTSFSKSSLDKPNDNDYIERFILESKYGIIIHYFSAFISIIIPLFDWHMFMGSNVLYGLTIGLPVMTVNAVLIILPGFVLRYNLKKLYIIHEFNSSKRK